MSHRVNITRIRVVSDVLGPLKDQVVFVGGATVSLYVDRAAEEARPTEDIDILVEIATYKELADFEDEIRKRGFINDTSGDFICRYLLPEAKIIVDVMPTVDNILGFTNAWYEKGFKSAIDYRIDDSDTVKIFSPPYFIASKLEAFNNRGQMDGRTSTDFEDIVYVLENRRSIWKEMKEANEELESYLRKQFTQLYSNKYIDEWIASHSSYNSPPSVYYILDDMNKFIS